MDTINAHIALSRGKTKTEFLRHTKLRSTQPKGVGGVGEWTASTVKPLLESKQTISGLFQVLEKKVTKVSAM